MINLVRNLILCCVIGFGVNWVCDQTASSFLRDFLKTNLVTILVALAAINATTMSVVLTQLREMLDRRGESTDSFEGTIRELRISFIEQIVLIALAIIGETAATSSKITSVAPNAAWLGQALATGTFIYSLYITFDTVNAIFVLLRFKR